MDSKKQEPNLELLLSIEPPPPERPDVLPSVGSVPLTLTLPFPWATDTPAIHHPLSVLVSRGIRTVHGDFQCRSWQHRVTVAYDLLEKYEQVSAYLLLDRAPAKWIMHPEHRMECPRCGRKGSIMRPVVDEREERINWLFLFLGQMLGACKKRQLKWFCRRTNFHCTANKDRLLYYSYVAICTQLQPHHHFLNNTLLQAASMPQTTQLEIRIDPRHTPPFRWATDRPAHIHPIAYLVHSGLHSVDGEAKCGGCGHNQRVAYDVRAKFQEIFAFIDSRVEVLNDRAPKEWLEPAYPSCPNCGKGMEPVDLDKTSGEKINWLFLFLGQMLGLCTLDLLKWYCKQHNIHTTGAKNRILYSSYISICGQLRPDIPLFQQLLRRRRAKKD